MKNLWVVCLIALTLLLIPAWAGAADNKPSDVPIDHWAYKAVKLLLDRGYLGTYQDGTFQGDKPVDRYTLAVVIAKILNEVATGKASPNKDDMALLKKLTTEFNDDLVLLAQTDKLLDGRIKKLEDGSLVLKEDIGKLNDFQIQALQMLEGITKRIEALEAQVADLKEELANQKKQMWALAIVAAILGMML